MRFLQEKEKKTDREFQVELNTAHKDEKTQSTVYDYPLLNGDINTLAVMVKDYYLKEIVPVLFKYEFLK
ncbi:hypothetical protein IX306_000011 [Porphyromonas levii]|uniref:hypothetical protein n=1 Tax=Porphyromonas levii TaxID=28114 RepID=UPI001BA66D93|nr:hypothetical protein [Porphyromonas levii]MBR8765567.1 hypothetical protein [Porphyromonas levii]MBR8772911.1 hypothetical protein [Porphyromonas levii]